MPRTDRAVPAPTISVASKNLVERAQARAAFAFGEQPSFNAA
jgi:hypothetical protein